AELYKPFGAPLRYIFLPRVFAEDVGFTQFDTHGNAVNQFDVNDYGAELSIGREFGRAAALFVGVRRYSGDVDGNIRDPSLQRADFDGGEYVLNLQYDRLDDRYFPSTGGFFKLGLIDSDESLGADSEFSQIEAQAFHAWSRSRHNFVVGGRYNTTLDDD